MEAIQHEWGLGASSEEVLIQNNTTKALCGYLLRSEPNSSDRLIFIVKRRAKDGRFFSNKYGRKDGQN